jgi:transglutaminase-like putative cysteine protease
MGHDRTHRRLAVLMGLAGLVAFSGGAGVQPVSSLLAGAALVLSLFWLPRPETSARLEKVWGALALILVARALLLWFEPGGDVVVPVVDLLLLLLCAESLRAIDAGNDVRIYTLSFALLLAATAYRPGLFFAFAFAAFVVAASLALPLGLLRRKARRYGARPPSLDRTLLATSARLAVVTLATAAIVFVTFPRVSRGWSGRGDRMATSVAGFADAISLGEHGSRIYSNPEIVLRVEFPDGMPENLFSLHWRGRSYDRFDGVRWTRSEGVRPSSAPMDWYRERWDGPVVTQRIYGAPLDVRVLFALHPVVEIDADPRTQPMFDNVGDFFYWGRAAPVYEARSRRGSPPADSLRRAEAGFMPDRTRYLQLPRLPDRIDELADSLTRGEATRYDKAVAIERWLRTEFDYTRELPRTAGETGLDHFLFERRAGHCEYFSSAMVVLLRSVGVHARNVNGFLGGRWNEFGRYLAVTQNEAHSWVEVWFPGYGWVEFDPTPGGSGLESDAREWLWPGRIFFDGLQHRWSKWVLDYSADDQIGLMDRFGAWLEESRASRGEGTRRGPPSWLSGLLVAGAVIAAGSWILRLGGRGPRPTSPESRAYVALLRRARRRGLAPGSAVTPLDLVDRLRAVAPAAAPEAVRVVELYLRARFGARPLSRQEMRELRAALSAARRAMD